VTATFDPVSATATVILHSPTTTERDRVAVEYLARVLAVEATELGREMFQRTSDVTGLPA
jgi:manganese-dependent inorganic pyrophosphatase